MANISPPTEAVRLENQIALNYLIRNRFVKEQIKDALKKPSIDIDYQNADGDTPLHLALDTENDEISEELVDRDAKGNIENNRHKTAISILDEKLQSSSSSSKHDKWNSMRNTLKRRANGQLQGEPSSSRPRLNDTQGTTTHDTSPVEKPKIHPTAGIRTSLHGIIFQLRLSMLCAVRARKKGVKPFEMASEIVPAEKFDDVAYRYDAPISFFHNLPQVILNFQEIQAGKLKRKTPVFGNTETDFSILEILFKFTIILIIKAIIQCWLFLQAKHKLDPVKNRITITNLMSTSDKEPFSLQKYFVSFCKIKSSKWFKNANLKDFIIITNTDFDFNKGRHAKDDPEKWKNMLEEQDDFNQDDMLYIENCEAVKYKLNVTQNPEFKEEMKANLINSVLTSKILKNNTDLEAITNVLNDIKTIYSDASITGAIRVSDEITKKTTIKDIKSECKKILNLQRKHFDDLNDEFDSLRELMATMARNSPKNKEVQNKARQISEEIRKKFEISKRKLNVCTAVSLKDLRKIEKSMQNEAMKPETIADNKSAVKQILLEHVILETSYAVENMESSIFESSAKLLKLKGKMLECQKYDNLINYRKDLIAHLNECQNDSKAVEVDQVKKLKQQIMEECHGILHDVMEKLDDSKKLLGKYDAEFEAGKKVLRKMDAELKTSKDIILKFKDIDEIKQHCKMLASKKHITTTFCTEIQAKTDADLEEIKGKIGETLSQLISEISIIQIVLCNQNIDALFTEFFNKFYIITNYPDQEKLGGYIDGEFCDLLNLLESKLVGAAFERRMMDFLKFYENGMAEYFTHGNMKEFMKSLKRELRGQYAIGINALYVKGLNDYRIRFKNNSEQMKTFIDPIKDQTQIYHLKTTNLQSSATKVQHIIEESGHYKQNNSYVTHLIKLFDEQEFRFQAFEMEKSHLLLVITCNEADDNKHKSFNELGGRLLNIFDKKSSIKLILISSNDFSIDMVEFFKGLNTTYPFKHNSEQLETFIDPTKDQSQTYHFRTTTLRLSAIKVLHTARTCDQYRHDNSYIFTDLNALLTEDKEPNEKCLLPQEIILEAFQMEKSHSLLVIECNMTEDDVQRVDYNEFFQRLKEILTNNSRKKLILISNDLSFGQLKAQGDHKDQIFFRDLEDRSQTRVIEERVLFQGATNKSKVQLKKLIDETSADRIFNQKILSEFLEITMQRDIKKKNIKIGNDKAFSSIDYTKDSYISRHFRSEQIERDEKYFYTAESLEQKVVIVANEAGMGKSTVLTSLANQMKKSQEHLWIVKINLHDHSGSRKQPSLCELKDNSNTMNTVEAIEFVSKMVVANRRFKSQSIRSMESKLFEMGLTEDSNTQNEGDNRVSNQTNQHKLRKPKIVIMFDGFDEVSRKHSNSTTALIKALKSSQVIQIWITTRKLEMTDLEKELNTCAHSLIPLESKEQRKLASILWKKKLKFKKSSTGKKLVNKKIDEICVYLRDITLPSEKYTKRLKTGIWDIAERDSKDWKRSDLTVAINQLDFTDYIDELIERLKPVEITDVHFTTNPLHLTMLTEVIFDDKFLLHKMNGIFDLFKKFVDMKFSIYCERANLDDSDMAKDVHDMLSDDSLWKIHRTLAAKEFDIHNIIPNLQSKCDKIMSSKGKIILSRIGFLKQDDDEKEKEKVWMVFTHRSYAEFFCSIYLIKKLEKPEVQELTRDLFGPTNSDKYALMHRFFNENPEKPELKERVLQDLHPKSAK